MVRIKYLHLRDTGEKPKDELCYGVIQEYEKGMPEPVSSQFRHDVARASNLCDDVKLIQG
jgi:hypothetical protein